MDDPDLPASLFHITDFYHYDLMYHLKNFCTRYEVGPCKRVSKRAPHLLRPSLSRTI